MDGRGIRLARGALRAALAERGRRALESGALQPIATREAVIEDGGVRFRVRQASSLADREAARERAEPTRRSDPFLPPDPALVVADVSDTHVAVLNRFPVLEGHFLLVTRAFLHQEELLDADDFAALAAALAEIDGLGFYNAGRAAGASQDHKHLQLVPLGGTSPALPIELLLGAAGAEGGANALPGLSFAHAFARLEALPSRAALAETYGRLLAAVGIRARESGGAARSSEPYNLLATRRWMLLVPRGAECFGGISVNALGFAGIFFVRDAAQMEQLRAAGPMAVLRAVARAPSR